MTTITAMASGNKPGDVEKAASKEKKKKNEKNDKQSNARKNEYPPAGKF